MHHLEEFLKGICAHLSFKCHRPLAKVCVQNSWGSPSSTLLDPVTSLRQETEVLQRGSHHCMNQVAELLGAIPLLSVCLQTRRGVVACSTTFEGRRCLCSVRSDVWKPVSKSFPRFFRHERGKAKGQQYKFPISKTSVDTLLSKCKHSYTTAVYVLYKLTYILLPET